MCSRDTLRALLVGALAAIDHGAAAAAASPADKAKIQRTLLALSEYAPGQRPVLPEHRPVGPMAAPPLTLLGGAF